jgi:hypothetical protein
MISGGGPGGLGGEPGVLLDAARQHGAAQRRRGAQPWMSAIAECATYSRIMIPELGGGSVARNGARPVKRLD